MDCKFTYLEENDVPGAKLTKKPNALKPLPDALINLHQKGQQKGFNRNLSGGGLLSCQV